MHRQFNIAYAVEDQRLYYPISWDDINIHEFGDLGELVCDLTMMILGFKKSDAKYGGNKGIDGFYKKDSIVIIAEAKMWKNDEKISAPDLDSIDRTHLTPKFNRGSKGAIVKIEAEKPEIYTHIINAHQNSSLYSIPFGVLPDGTAYMRINQRLDLIQSVVPSVSEESNALTTSAQTNDSSFITPKKEKEICEPLASDELIRQLSEMSGEEIEKNLPQLQKLFKKMNIQSPTHDENDYEYQEFLKELYDYLRTTEPNETCDIQMINESFEVIRGIYENSIERSGNVSVINLEGARLLQKALLVNTFLKKLSLHDIDGAKLDIIQIAFRKNPDIALNYLDIWGEIPDESMEEFSLSIKNCIRLRTLSLKACSISDDGACYLADALCLDNHALATLDLSHNHIGLTGAKALAKMIKLNPNLRRIYLHGNSEMGQEGVDLIRESMSSNFRLNDVTLAGCS